MFSIIKESCGGASKKHANSINETECRNWFDT